MEERVKELLKTFCNFVDEQSFYFSKIMELVLGQEKVLRKFSAYYLFHPEINCEKEIIANFSAYVTMSQQICMIVSKFSEMLSTYNKLFKNFKDLIEYDEKVLDSYLFQLKTILENLENCLQSIDLQKPSELILKNFIHNFDKCLQDLVQLKNNSILYIETAMAYFVLNKFKKEGGENVYML